MRYVQCMYTRVCTNARHTTITHIVMYMLCVQTDIHVRYTLCINLHAPTKTSVLSTAQSLCTLTLRLHEIGDILKIFTYPRWRSIRTRVLSAFSVTSFCKTRDSKDNNGATRGTHCLVQELLESLKFHLT